MVADTYRFYFSKYTKDRCNIDYCIKMPYYIKMNFDEPTPASIENGFIVLHRLFIKNIEYEALLVPVNAFNPLQTLRSHDHNMFFTEDVAEVMVREADFVDTAVCDHKHSTLHSKLDPKVWLPDSFRIGLYEVEDLPF